MNRDTGNGLRDLQRWMLSLVSHPDGVAAGEAAAREAGVLAERDRVEDRLEASATLTPEQRVGVYAGMYFERLIESLEMDHPGLRHALGGDEFRSLARDYAVAHPSSVYTLSRYGEHLPRYLAEQAGERPAGQFLVELATLERVVLDVFHERRAPTLQVTTLQSIPQEQWSGLSLRPVPACRLLQFEYPVSAYLDEVHQEGTPSVPEIGPCRVLVHRSDFVVRRRELCPESFQVLMSLFEGQTLAEGLERAMELTSRPAEDLLTEVGTWFQEWMTWGVFEDLGSDDERGS